MVRKTIPLLCLLSGLLLLWNQWGTQPASAHGPVAENLLNLPRCNARLMACQPPVETEAAFTEINHHACMDGMGVQRSCQLEGPFDYFEFSTEFVERDLPRLDPLSFTPCENGFADQYPCQNVDLLSFLPLADIGGGEGSDLWGWTDPETGREYALMGRTNGTAFVDITTPTAPVYLGDLPSYSQESAIWRDIKVYANHAFIIQDSISRTMDHGLQIFDLRQLRDVKSPAVTFETTAHYPGFRVAHNIAINEETGYAYIVEQSGPDKRCERGLHMVDISTPTEPTFAGCFDEDGYSHDAQCVIYRGPDFDFHGHEICFTSDEDALTIADVSNKLAPQLLGSARYDTEEVNEDLNSFYVHQGWLTEDQRYFLQNDEADEAFNVGVNTRTNVWDVSDLRNPVWQGFHDLGTTSSDHNLYIEGSHIYEANYLSGFRVLQTTDLTAAALSEVAYFDTSPESDDAGFSGGAWSSYPYFESGTVIVSTITEGLFVLAPKLAPEFMVIPNEHHIFTCTEPAKVSRGTAQLPSYFDGSGSVQIAAFNGYAGEVTLTTHLAEPVGTAELGNIQVVFDGAEAARINVPIQLQDEWTAGTHQLTVLGSDQINTASTELLVHVVANAPGPVANLAATANSQHYTLSWASAAAAELYQIEIASDANFANIIESGRSTATEYLFVQAELEAGSEYYWRVRAVNGCGEAISTVATLRANDAVFMPVIQ